MASALALIFAPTVPVSVSDVSMSVTFLTSPLPALPTVVLRSATSFTSPLLASPTFVSTAVSLVLSSPEAVSAIFAST